MNKRHFIRHKTHSALLKLCMIMLFCTIFCTMTACTKSGDMQEASDNSTAVSFQETGVFGISVSDRNQETVNAWLDSTTNTYYLFLTNACSIPDLELNVTGIRMKETSAGTLDTDTNTVTGAFAANGDAITLTAEDGTVYNVVVKQSGLPSLCISLNGTTLDEINSQPEGTSFEGESLVLTDASGNINVAQSDVEIRGRGNTTWAYSDKKPYQLHFSERQSVLGMAEAKKWVLLASAFDDSMLRNKTAYYLGDAIEMTFSPDLEFTDLWVDGEYRGTYTIGVKSEISYSRLHLEDSQGALMELDNFFYGDEDYSFEDTVMSAHFAMDEWVDDTQADAAFANFQTKEAAFSDYLFNTDPSEVTVESLSQYIDVESIAKWYLVNEYLSNVESFSTSWLWYCDGPSDVLHMGPLWDFDTSQGIPTDYSDTSLMFGKTNNLLINRLFQSSAFSSYVEQVFTQYRSAFSSLSGLVSEWGSQLSEAADCNYTRWQWLGGENLKGKPFAATYDGAISDLRNWLSARDVSFGIGTPPAPAANTSVNVSESGKYLTVTADNVTGISSLTVAVWSDSNGQDDLKWYTLTGNPDGSMSVNIDLTQHGSSDTYFADVYGDSTYLGEQVVNVTMDADAAAAEGAVATAETAQTTGDAPDTGASVQSE